MGSALRSSEPKTSSSDPDDERQPRRGAVSLLRARLSLGREQLTERERHDPANGADDDGESGPERIAQARGEERQGGITDRDGGEAECGDRREHVEELECSAVAPRGERRQARRR